MIRSFNVLKGILSQSVGSTQNDDMMLYDSAESGDSGLARTKGILPWPDSLIVGGFSLLWLQ